MTIIRAMLFSRDMSLYDGRLELSAKALPSDESTYCIPIMSIIHSPPLVDEFLVHKRFSFARTPCHPRLLLADKVYH